MNSLRDQLLKAGLVSKKKAKEAEALNRKTQHDVQTGKEAGKQHQAEKEEELRAIEIAAEEKRLADLERNREIETERRAHEAFFRCKQLIASNRLNEFRAQIPYYFVEDGRYVRRVLVDVFQKEMLTRGKFAIARLSPDVDEFTILPVHTALTIRSLQPEMILVVHEALDDSHDLAVE